MIIAAHQTMLAPTGAPLPYDAEVEYLTAGGTQWIDTGVSLASGAVRCKVLFSQNVASSFALGVQGDATTGGTASKRLLFFGGSNGGNIDRGTAGSRISFDATADYDSGKIAFAITLNTAKNIYLFDANGISGNKLRGRIYLAQIWDSSNNLIRDYIPVRVGTAGALYDRANPTGGPNGNGLYLSETSTPLAPGNDI